MRWLRNLAVIVVGLAALFLYLFPSYTHRYRMTVEIEADGVVHTGTSVVDVTFQFHGPLTGLVAGEYEISIDGQATLIELGKRGVVLAVLKPITFPGSYTPKPLSATTLAIYAFHGANWTKGSTAKKILSTLQNQKEKKTLDETMLPGFVWLSDPKDRGTAVPVAPQDMEKVIGAGVRLRSVSIEMTSDRNTKELFEKLPWLTALWEEERKHGTSWNAQQYSLTALQIFGYNK